MEKVQPPTVTFGPYGGNGGTVWDDEIHDGVKKLIIYSDEEIYSIEVEYEDGWKSKHGGSGGVAHEIVLDYPTEHLTSLKGYFGPQTGGIIVVKSLTLESSNEREFGPYGPQDGTPFDSKDVVSGKIVGFLGRSGDLLDAIGAYFATDTK